MSDNKAFSLDLSKLKKTNKDDGSSEVDNLASEQGFVSREVKKRGRKPSPRTGQVHARVLPSISNEIADEAKRRGTQQGVVIEEAWELYKEKHNL